MLILLIRHAIAEDVDDSPGKSDATRRLTGPGRRKMQAAAVGLKHLLKTIDVLASSPLVRARETADLVSAAYGSLPVVEVEALAGGVVRDVVRWIQQQPAEAQAALVGHKPGLGMLASYLLSGRQRSFIEFRKGGACLIEFDVAVRAGKGRLVWMLKPGQLRVLGK